MAMRIGYSIKGCKIHRLNKRKVRKYTESAFTHFGFQKVKEDDKNERVKEVFSNVAEKYDLMNDTMSLGIHRIWKNDFVNMSNPRNNTKLLDVAGGTGDIAFRYIQKLKDSGCYNPKTVNICDINKEMLEVGKKRANNLGFENISWTVGNAEELPFDSNQFDLYTIAFGIRNCTHIDRVLSEAHRVLKPGGRFMCLEFSDLNSPSLQKLYDLYSFQIIPVMGEVIAGDWASYQYLVESIRKFPKPIEFENMIKSSGFKAVSHVPWTFGIVAVHSGFKF